MLYLLTVLIGAVAGLRTMTAPAAGSWAAWSGRPDLRDSWLAFLAHPISQWVLPLLAAGELVADKLPTTPSRKVPPSFAARIVSGALVGAAFGQAGLGTFAGAALGVIGAVVGTLGG